MTESYELNVVENCERDFGHSCNLEVTLYEETYLVLDEPRESWELEIELWDRSVGVLYSDRFTFGGDEEIARAAFRHLQNDFDLGLG